MIEEKKLLSEISDLKKNMKSENSDYLKGYMSALSMIEGIISEQNKIGEWISCKNPPDSDREVLIFNGKRYSVGYYENGWVNTSNPVEWQEIRHDAEKYAE